MSSDSSDSEDIPDVAECQKLCEQFAEITGTDVACAQFYLQDRSWNLDVNIKLNFLNSFKLYCSILYFIFDYYSKQINL